MPLAEKNPLSSNAIKLIAIAAMTVDHIAWAVFPGVSEGISPPAHASHRAHHLPDHVLLHRRVVYFFAIDRVYGILQMGVALSLPVLRLYNGQRGKSPAANRFMRWFFYLYYPAHLLLIGLLIHV